MAMVDLRPLGSVSDIPDAVGRGSGRRRPPRACLCHDLYLPVREPEDPARDPQQPLPDDSRAVAAWLVRMGTYEAKELYKDRAATAECVNAIARNRGSSGSESKP
jgi:hypothetical protein